MPDPLTDNQQRWLDRLALLSTYAAPDNRPPVIDGPPAQRKPKPPVVAPPLGVAEGGKTHREISAAATAALAKEIRHSLRAMRERRGLSQDQVAARLGISERRWRAIENGERHMHAEEMVAALLAMGGATGERVRELLKG